MTWPEPLLLELERFVHAVVVTDAGAESHELSAKLDVLERVVELLRLRAGRVRNARSMGGLLGGGVAVQHDGDGRPARLVVGAGARDVKYGMDNPRSPDDLHAPLLLYLLRGRTAGERIGDDLHHFILAIADDLGPADVETTETGVMRIATTTRMAARALRLFGLIRDSHETRTKTWNLTLLGILCALEIGEWHASIKLPRRPEGERSVWKPGGGERLAFAVEQSIMSFAHEGRVRNELSWLLAGYADEAAVIDKVAPLLVVLCSELDGFWHGIDNRVRTIEEDVLRARAAEMRQRIEAVVPPSDVAKLAAVAYAKWLDRVTARAEVE